MTITATSSVISYNGDGTSTAFPFPYEFLDASHLVVNLVDIASGAVTPQSSPANYTVSGAGNPDGGTVTMVVAPPSGSQLKIQRIVPLVQLIDLESGDTFPADTMEGALDYLTMAVQQISDLYSGASVPPSGGGTNTFLNLGAGHGVYLQTIGSQVQLRGLVAGSNVTITHNATDITIAAAGVAGALLAANNLSDVASRQAALNTLTAAAGGGNEFVLTRDTTTGNAVWKVVPTGGAGEANTMSSSGAGSSIVQAKAGVNLPVRSFVAGANMSIVQNANDLTFSATTSGEVNTGQNIGVAGTGIFAGKVGLNLQFKGLAAGAGLTMSNNATDVTPAVNQAYPFVFTGQPKFNSGADVPDHPFSSFPKWAARFSQTNTPTPSAPASVQAAIVCNSYVPANSYDYCWNAMFYCETHSTVKDNNVAPPHFGESLPLYTKGYAYGTAPIWGMCIEAQDIGGNDVIMHGIEIDLCAPGLDPLSIKKGIAIYYGDAFPRTSTAGPPTRQYCGILMAPFAPGVNRLGYGVIIGAGADEAFAASNTGGLVGFGAYGSYSVAALNMGIMTNTPIAIDIAGGSMVKFRSGRLGNAAYPDAGGVWYPGNFAPAWFGAIAIKVDATTLYIPICSNHP